MAEEDEEEDEEEDMVKTEEAEDEMTARMSPKERKITPKNK